MASTAQQSRWVLELVRGRDVGRCYSIGPGENVIGNAPGETQGFDLSDQEGQSPRRMAARQASLTVSGEHLAIRDLGSPGGTFVNRQRLLNDQVRMLNVDDVIQVGAVQLRVKREPGKGAVEVRPTPEKVGARPRVPDAKPGALAIPFKLAGGASCRTWDDFLVLSAQRWAELRQELTSGRLADHLRRIERAELLPRPDRARSEDEQLDDWLARLPVTRASEPEIEVHPEVLVIRSASGGGRISRPIRIANVGYRLLRCTARVDGGGGRIELPAEFSGRPFVTIEQTELPVHIELPEDRASGPLGAVVIESNGGTRRVEIRIERISTTDQPVQISAAPDLTALTSRGSLAGERLSRLSMGRRIVLGSLLFLFFRLGVLLLGLIPLGDVGGSRAEPRLGIIALALAVVGALAAIFPRREQGWGPDRSFDGFAGALAGVIIATVGYAILRSIERILGEWSSSTPAVLLLWMILGAVAALVSGFAFPPPAFPEPEPPR